MYSKDYELPLEPLASPVAQADPITALAIVAIIGSESITVIALTILALTSFTSSVPITSSSQCCTITTVAIITAFGLKPSIALDGCLTKNTAIGIITISGGPRNGCFTQPLITIDGSTTSIRFDVKYSSIGTSSSTSSHTTNDIENISD